MNYLFRFSVVAYALLMCSCVQKSGTENVPCIHGKLFQIKTLSKLLVLEEDALPPVDEYLKEDGALYSEGEIQFLMRRLSTQKGIRVITMPSIVSRIGESATMEIIREVPINGRLFKWSKYSWLGHELKVKSTLSAEVIHSKVDYEYHYAEGMMAQHLNDYKGIDFSRKVKIQELKNQLNISMKSVASRVIKLKAAEGEVRYLIISQTLIDASGSCTLELQK